MLFQQIQETVDFLASKMTTLPRIGMITGTGLGGVKIPTRPGQVVGSSPHPVRVLLVAQVTGRVAHQPAGPTAVGCVGAR